MNIRTTIATAAVASLFPLIASAHVVVQPTEAHVASFQTFSIGVPSEKASATIRVRLVVPAGLESVTPNVKPGWSITTKQDASSNVTEIVWTGTSGKIPGYQRDDFAFSAKVPPTATTVQWKVYQTYADGSVETWDSATKVVTDLSTKNLGNTPAETASFTLSMAALVVAALALSRTKN